MPWVDAEKPAESEPHVFSMPAHTSNASTFITNLRLLDLDKQQDWPAITAQILTAKDALQNQKRRIQCVEWALYRLFEIWDPQEASAVGLNLNRDTGASCR